MNSSPDYAEAFYNRGLARKAKGDRAGAVTDFAGALQFRPDLAEAYANRGLTLLELNKDTEAQRDFDQYVRLKPTRWIKLQGIIEKTKRQRQQGKQS